MDYDFLDFIEGRELEYQTGSHAENFSGIYGASDSTEAADFRELYEDELLIQNALRSYGTESKSFKPYTQGYDQHATQQTNFQYSSLSGISNEARNVGNGILLTLWENVSGISEKLRYAYLTRDEAVQRGMSMTVLQHLQKVKDKLITIYQNCGGHESTLMKAILTGKGNANSSYVPVTDDVHSVYSDQQEFNRLYAQYGVTRHRLVSDLITTLDNILKNIEVPFIIDAANNNTLSALADNIVKQNDNSDLAVDAPEEKKSIVTKTVDWITDNPIKSLLIGGLAVAGGISLKKYIDMQCENKSKLEGFGMSRSASSSKKRTGRRAVKRGSVLKKKTTFATLQ
jgi:hypothetical protein